MFRSNDIYEHAKVIVLILESKMRFFLIAIPLIITLAISMACMGPGESDFQYTLPNKYKMFRPSAHGATIIPDNDAEFIGPVIGPHILSIEWNERYVFYQREILGTYNGDEYIPEKPPYKNEYGILDTKDRHIIGPFVNFSNFMVSANLLYGSNLILKPARFYLENKHQ